MIRVFKLSKFLSRLGYAEISKSSPSLLMVKAPKCMCLNKSICLGLVSLMTLWHIS